MSRTRIHLYGGVNEIGGNKFLIEHEDHRLLLDFGMSFGSHGAFFAKFLEPRGKVGLTDLLRMRVLPGLPGIYRQDCCRLDGVEPIIAKHGFSELWSAPIQSYGDYLREHGRPFVDAVVLSHAHMDHFGHFGYLDPRIPIYATPITLAALKALDRLSRGGVEGEIVTGKTLRVSQYAKGAFAGGTKIEGGKEWKRPLYEVAPYAPQKVGPFELTLLAVDHSIPGAAAARIRVGGKTILYSGDVRFHGAFEADTARLRSEVDGMAPDVLLCEGTRIDSDEPDSEEGVRRDLTATFRETAGLGIVDFGWKDTTRFETLQQVAAQTNRTLVINYKLAYLLHRLHKADSTRHRPAEDYANVRVFVSREGSMRYEDADYNKELLRLGYFDGPMSEIPRNDPSTFLHRDRGVTAVDVRRQPSKFLLMMGLYDMQDLVDIEPPRGSAFVRAACEPYSDEMDMDLRRQARWLRHFGFPVRDRDDREPIPVALHASGHACGPHILEFIRLVRPRLVVPIHTANPVKFEDAGTGVLSPEIGATFEV